MNREITELTEITLKMIIDEGVIQSDTIIYSDTNPVKIAKINSEGFIELDINGNQKQFPYPSGAARALVNLSVNGWKFWKVIINNEKREISELRNLYNEKKSKT